MNNQDRTIVTRLSKEDAMKSANWTTDDTLVIGTARLPFTPRGNGPRPKISDGSWAYLDTPATLAFLDSSLAHIERTTTEPWYAEAVRRGWLYQESTNDQTIRCISKQQGLVVATIRDNGFELYWQGGVHYSFLMTIEDVLNFATPYHMEGA